MSSSFRRRPRPIAIVLAASLSLGSMTVAADYRADIGYTKLQQDLGGSIPTGAGVVISQVEGEQTANSKDWMPDITNGEFVGKSIINESGGVASGHATPVGQAFYGSVTSMTPAITNISAYGASDWVGPGFLITVVGSGGARPLISTTRVANHSWVGNATGSTYALRRADWLVETDEFILVVGVENNPGIGNNSTSPLMATAYNAIAVGLSSGLHGVGGVAVDSTYVAGRTRPDIVAPAAGTSISTPYVSAAAGLLVQYGNSNPGLSQGSMTNRAGVLVRNAGRSEVIKAALMAGADRVTHNSAPNPTNLASYRGTAPNQTANGLDRRYGAGQLNIRNSYWIIAGGEQSSTEDGNVAPTVSSRGFDYDPGFGGNSGTNATATYPLPVENYPRLLTATLAWNLDITGSSGNPNNNFDPAVTTVCSASRTLCNLNVALIDLANGNAVVASSASTVDNTENLWIAVPPNAQYALRVTKSGSNFVWDYGLAWQLRRDTDADTVYDDSDNCINIANPEQIDSDSDGYGNHCDGDFNNNSSTNAQDYVLFKLQLGQPSTPPNYNQCDMNANGFVNAQDYVLFRATLGAQAGPSGLAP